jgi:hypothetical protein
MAAQDKKTKERSYQVTYSQAINHVLREDKSLHREDAKVLLRRAWANYQKHGRGSYCLIYPDMNAALSYTPEVVMEWRPVIDLIDYGM